MKILIITDIHYGEDTNYPQFGGEKYINSFGSRFEKFLPEIKKLVAEHDLVINLGDLIHNLDTEQDIIEYRKAIKLLEMGKPVKHVFGNHDFSFIPRGKLAEFIGTERPYYSFELGGYHHVMLDSFRNSKKEPCRIDDDQIEWLRQDLNKTNLPVIVYCHYPLDDQPLENNYYFKDKPDRAFIANKEYVRSILESSDKVIIVFSGHLHFFHEEVINNIQYITIPAFTENNGKDQPKSECLSVTLEGKKIEFQTERLF